MAAKIQLFRITFDFSDVFFLNRAVDALRNYSSLLLYVTVSD
jgi:hypothetical protein